jgi:hypothetical protein
MIISHEYKFIFIKTEKTAGTSIEVFLSQCCGDQDVVTPIKPHVEPHKPRNYTGIWNPIPVIIKNRNLGAKKVFNLLKKDKFYNHIPGIDVRNRVSKEIWNTYFKFCVERNPWDKTLSHYHMMSDRTAGGIIFEDYIRKGRFCTNYQKYTDSNGRLIVDKVIKYESLNSELTQIFDRLGVPFEGTLGVRAKSDYRTDRRSYQEVFTEEQKEVITKAFRKEIEIHGYSF